MVEATTRVSIDECVMNTLHDYEKKMNQNVFYRWIDEYCNRIIDSGNNNLDWDFEDYIFKPEPPKFGEKSRVRVLEWKTAYNKRKKMHLLKEEKYRKLLPNDDNLTDEQKVEKRKELATAAKYFAVEFWDKKPQIRALYYARGERHRMYQDEEEYLHVYKDEEFMPYYYDALDYNKNNHYYPDTILVNRALDTKGRFFTGEKESQYSRIGWFKNIEFMATPQVIDYLEKATEEKKELKEILERYKAINDDLRKQMKNIERPNWEDNIVSCAKIKF